MSSIIKINFFFKFLFLLILITGCTENKTTGTRQLVLLDSKQEEDIGAKEHPKILKFFGGVYGSKELKNYVSKIGKNLANISEMPNLKWKFTILDSPLVNAFALPGGYVYISRGLLSLANDEAELANVLGHEIAHVTSRHAAQRHAKETLSEIGLSILDIVIGQPIISNVANLGRHGVLAAFSRSEEMEADEIGRRYALQAGYDPYASSRFLNRLNDLSKLSDEQNKNLMNSIFSTHPRTLDRVEKASEISTNNDKKTKTNRNYYLAAINHIDYGESSKNGIIKNNKFLHLHLDIAFSVPNSFKIENRKDAVIARNVNKESILIFDGISGERDLTLIEIVESIIGRSRAELIKNLKIYDSDAVIVKDNKLVFFEDIKYSRTFVLIRWTDSQIWRFTILVNPNSNESVYNELENEVINFHSLSESEKKLAQPKKIKIHVSEKKETLLSLSKKMSLDKDKMEWLKIINGFSKDLQDNYQLQPGTLVKLIVE